MSIKERTTVTSGIEWNTMLGLLTRLRNDGQYREYLFIAAGCYLGLRAGDILRLKWSEVMNKEVLTVIEKKTGKKRRLTLNQYLRDAFKFVADELTRQGQFMEDSYIFSNRIGEPISIQFANRQLHKIFTRYNVRVQNGSTHTLRKTFGKRVWEMDNKSERALIYLSEIFSHSSIRVTRKYIGITEKQIADVYMKL